MNGILLIDLFISLKLAMKRMNEARWANILARINKLAKHPKSLVQFQHRLIVLRNERSNSNNDAKIHLN